MDYGWILLGFWKDSWSGYAGWILGGLWVDSGFGLGIENVVLLHVSAGSKYAAWIQGGLWVAPGV